VKIDGSERTLKDSIEQPLQNLYLALRLFQKTLGRVHIAVS
jgi:hypothetical protein